jgi:RNA polymerase sigma-70 factor (ECF subfamily)
MSEVEFTQSVTSVEKVLRGFAVSLTKDDEAAKDLVQDTMLRAYKYRRKFQPGTNFKAWIMKIMKNIFLNDFNKNKKKPDSVCVIENEYLLSTSERVAQNQANTNIRLDEINREINRLDEKYSKSLMMYYSGFKYQEIAARFGVPLGTVKNRIHVARESLKKTL